MSSEPTTPAAIPAPVAPTEITAPVAVLVGTLSKLDWIRDAAFRHWQTTGSGLIAAAACFVVTNPGLGLPPLVMSIASFIFAGGLAALGIAGKDAGKSGNPGRPSA